MNGGRFGLDIESLGFEPVGSDQFRILNVVGRPDTLAQGNVGQDKPAVVNDRALERPPPEALGLIEATSKAGGAVWANAPEAANSRTPRNLDMTYRRPAKPKVA